MDRELLRSFQRQVAIQCRWLLLAARDVNKGLQNKDVNYTFYAVQNLLNAGANISKSFWGQGGRLAAERKPLRDSIGVDDTSPLREVTMRNNFEHFDERLDRWWKQSARHHNVDMNIGPKGNMIKGVDDIDMFRQFDPRTADVTFWGQEFNIKQLVAEVEKILPKVEEEANKETLDRLARMQARKAESNVGERENVPAPTANREGTHLTIYEKEKFSGVDVDLDGNEYNNCTFLNCTLVFRGTKGSSLSNNNFTGSTRFRFDGAAGSTLNFLKAMAHPSSGLSDVVRKSFPEFFSP